MYWVPQRNRRHTSDSARRQPSYVAIQQLILSASYYNPVAGLEMNPILAQSSDGSAKTKRIVLALKLARVVEPDKATSKLQGVIDLMADNLHKPHYLNILGLRQQDRWELLSQLSDLNNSISNLQRAAELVGDDPKSKPLYLSNLGNSLGYRFERLGERSDIEKSISSLQKAIQLTNEQDPDVLINLGKFLLTRFKAFRNLADADESITALTTAMHLTDDEYPAKYTLLSNLGRSYLERYERLHNVADLAASITHEQEAISLSDDRAANLTNIGSRQIIRYKHFGDPQDLQDSITNLRMAVDLTNEGDRAMPTRLSVFGASLLHSTDSFETLSDFDECLSSLRKAVELTEDGDTEMPSRLLNCANGQRIFFERSGDMAILDESVSNLHKAVSLTSDEDPYKLLRTCSLRYVWHPVDEYNGCIHLTFVYLSAALLRRFRRLGELSDLEDSILNLQQGARLINDTASATHLASFHSDLGNSFFIRYERMHAQEDLTNSSFHMAKAVALTNDTSPEKPLYLTNYGSVLRSIFEQSCNRTHIEASISTLKNAIQLAEDNGHPGRPSYYSNLASSERMLFERLGEQSYLDTCILHYQTAVNLTSDDHLDRARHLFNLGNALRRRAEKTGDRSDFGASLVALQAAARSQVAYPRDASNAALKWGEVAYFGGDLVSALEGFRLALEWLPKIAWLGIDTPSRQNWLLEMEPETLSCMAASCAIHLGRLEEAVELLDMGRSFLWQQGSSLRGDLEVLKEEEPMLARKLESVGQQLDAGNFASLSFLDNIPGQNHEDVAKERRRLVGVWEGLLEEARQLPRFRYFLKPTPFHQLRRAATTGEVVIINVSRYAVDALVFGADSATQPIQHIPLTDIDIETLTELSGEILLQRPVNSTIAQQRRYVSCYLRPALRTVWEDIVVPIFDQMRIPKEGTDTPPQRRVWWYPTGPLTFIPIHAAGPGSAIDVTRLVVSSYVTTFDSLFRAQNRAAKGVAGPLKILAVSQPNTPGESPLPESTLEAEKLIQAASSAGWKKEHITHLDGRDATLNRVSTALNTCALAHFACHGLQHQSLGMKSAFALYDDRLELDEIASKNISTGQFAFLSVCHAAAGLHELPGE